MRALVHATKVEYSEDEEKLMEDEVDFDDESELHWSEEVNFDFIDVAKCCLMEGESLENVLWETCVEEEYVSGDEYEEETTSTTIMEANVEDVEETPQFEPEMERGVISVQEGRRIFSNGLLDFIGIGDEERNHVEDVTRKYVDDERNIEVMPMYVRIWMRNLQ